MRSQAQRMREHRQRLKDRGLVKVEVWVRPYDRQRLARYVRNRLDGHAVVAPASRSKTTGDDDG